MLPQSLGKIYLTDERGIAEDENHRSYNTFNYGNFFNQYKTPFGALSVLNEDTLAGQKSIRVVVTTAADIVIIPTIGDIEFCDSRGNLSVIQVGQAQLFSMSKASSFTITNPYGSELVSFLQLWLYRQPPAVTNTVQLFSFDIDSHKNSLVNIFHQIQHISSSASTQYVLSIVKLGGREEVLYKMNDPKNGLFAFVIEGAFEAQYRLLHSGDGLALWNIEEVEIEALSNNAIMLLLELPL